MLSLSLAEEDDGQSHHVRLSSDRYHSFRPALPNCVCRTRGMTNDRNDSLTSDVLIATAAVEAVGMVAANNPPPPGMGRSYKVLYVAISKVRSDSLLAVTNTVYSVAYTNSSTCNTDGVGGH